MRTLRHLAIVPVLLVLGSCGESDDSEQAKDTVAGNVELESSSPVSSSEEATPGQLTVTLANDQFGIDTVKIVFEHSGSEQGRSTLWIENYGERVAIETDLTTVLGPDRSYAYWDGDRLYRRDLETDELYDTPLRQRNMEPASVTIIAPADLAAAGYERLGDITIAGVACEHWRNPTINYETCFWNRIELLSINGLIEDGGFMLRHEAVEIVEGEGIPEDIRALAQ